MAPRCRFEGGGVDDIADHATEALVDQEEQLRILEQKQKKWGRRQFCLAGLGFLVFVWTLCYVLTTLAIHVLLRVSADS